MTKKKFVSIFLLFILIAGIPHYSYCSKNKMTSPEVLYEYAQIENIKKTNDPYLIEYIIKSVNNNHDLKKASLKIEETTETKNIQRSYEMPEITAGAVPALYKLPAETSSRGIISLPAYAYYEADIFGKNRDKTKSFDKLVEVSKQNERAAYISIVAATASAYYNIVKLDKLIDLQTDIIELRREIYRLMRLSNKEGLTSAADTVFANKSFIKAERDIIDLKKTRSELLNLLCVLTGESPENAAEIKRISFDELQYNPQIPEYIKSDVIFSRPDFLSAELMLEKNGLDVRAARKEFLPTINIAGLLSFNSTKYFSKLNWTNASAAIGAGILLPLFTGGRKIANLKLKKNQYEQALENYKQVSLTSIQEVNDALYNLKADNEKYLKTLDGYKAEKEDFNYTTLKYDTGVISKLDLLQKKENLIATEKLNVSDKVNLYIDTISLYKATTKYY